MLPPDQTILFTRQKHEAVKAGTHYDIRFVVGDKAYSFATKKEMPEEGNSILLYEQPVHTASYALSERVEIPKGQYGHGVTVLDFVRKAKVSPTSTHDKIVFHSGDERFLLKKLDDAKYGEKAWLFKNLGPKVEENKYLNQITKSAELEKQAIIGTLGVAAAVHVGQNELLRQALKSKRLRQHVADGFQHGVHGVVDKSMGTKAKEILTGAALPDVHSMYSHAHQLGRELGPQLKGASKRQLVGLRMATEGRFGDLAKKNLHNDPVVRAGYSAAQKKFGLPDLDEAVRNAPTVQKVYQDKKNPITSNILSGISRGKAPKGKNFVPGHPDSKKTFAGGVGVGAVEMAAGHLPVTGFIDTLKNAVGSEALAKTRPGKWIQDNLKKLFITGPAKKGAKTYASRTYDEIKSKAFEHLGNPLSTSIARTSAALTRAAKTGKESI